jgi:D-glycero-alpha-D-manno-heptose-7-phosphate kinase
VNKIRIVTAPVRIDISAGWSDADPFRKDFGGAVLNAAINLRVKGILNKKDLINSLDRVPASSGLGTSGALRTVYLVAANPSLIKNKLELIERVHVFENAIVGQRAGFQDQAAAIFGGVNYWEFKPDGRIVRKSISKKCATHLYDRLVLVYTGDKHLSSNVHQDVFGNGKFMEHIPAIDKMKKIAKKMYEHINDQEIMADLIAKTWDLQKNLHKGIETSTMKKIQEYCKDYTLASRATGAGGGGCMLFYAKPELKRGLVRRLKKLGRKEKGIKVLPFEFDFKGIEMKGK